jgi:voltage-gated potassium channel
MLERVKARVREIVQIPSAPDDVPGRLFDALIITLIVLNTIAVIIETLPGVQEQYGGALDTFEMVSVAVFIAEYLLRFWSITSEPGFGHPVTGRLRWMVTPFALIDIIAIVPAFVGVDLRFVRVLRVLRVLKLGRYAESVQILANVLRRSRADLLTSFALVMFALVLTASFMYYAEHEAQPEAFSSIPRAMWWAIIALTTTGYGDVVPVTDYGRFLGGVTAVLGVAAIALPIGILSSSFVQEIEQRRRRNGLSAALLAASVNAELDAKRKRASKLCPHCGKQVR